MYGACAFSVVELDEPPLDVNMRVIRALWHGAELDDLTNQIFTAVSGELAVLIFILKSREEVTLRSIFGTQQGIVPEVGVRQHQFMRAFTLSAYKPRGRTRQKLHVLMRTPLPPLHSARLVWPTLRL